MPLNPWTHDPQDAAPPARAGGFPENYIALFNFMTEAIFVADAQTGMIVDANPAAEALIGRSREEIRTLHQTQLHPSLKVEEARNCFAEHIRKPGIRELDVLHRDGRTIPVEISATQWVDPNGKRLVFGLFRDISERRKAEEALRRSEERFRQVAETAGEFIWEVDANGLYVYASQSVEKLLGYTPEELVGKLHFYDLFSPEVLAELKKAAFETFARREPFRALLNPNVAKNGRTVILQTSGMPLFDAGGSLIGYCGTGADVTERKRAENALRERESRLSEAASLAGIAYCSWDVQTDAREWSEEMYRLAGRDPSLAPLRPPELRNLYTAESWKRLQQALSWTAATGEPFELDLDIVRPDGDIRHTHVRGAAARDHHGQVIRVYGTLQDITERKIAQERLRQTQWSESFRALSRGMAHDFNNLLGAILAEAEVLLMEAPAGMHGLEGLRRIDGLARRASEIVRQLMIYSGQEQPATGPVDLSTMVRDILQLLRSSVSKNATLRAELSRNLPTVMADAAQLRQLIMNLVLNAAEAIGADRGIIGVTTSRVSVEENEIADAPAGDYLKLEVSDTGSGMSEEVRTRIFDPFFSTKADGRGLGLAVVQTIVRGAGGFIHVHSEPGRGSRFEVLLPCAPAVRGEPAAVSFMQAPRRSRTLLVVEDEDALRLAASKILARKGFAVLQAADGNAAVDLLQSANKIDAILLDVTIPGFTSHEVAAKAQLFQPKAKVVLTTAYSREMIMGSFESGQISGFIRKPYRLGELVQTLQGILSA